jgi:putative copper export protein
MEIAARWGAYLSLAVAAGGFGFLLLIWLPAASSLDLPTKRSKSSPSFLEIPSRSATLAVAASLGLLASLFALLVTFSANTSQGLLDALSASFGRDLLARVGAATGLLLVSLSLRRVARGPRAVRAPRGVPAANGGKAKGKSFFRGILQGFQRPAQEDLRPLWLVALGGFILSLVAVATFSISSHAASTIPPLGTAMDFVHLASLSLWIGGLFHVTLAAMPKLLKSTSPRVGVLSAEVAGNFSALATLMVGGMFISGGYLVLENVGSIDGLVGTAYGQTLLVKLALFFPLLGVGTYNHFKLRPSLAYTRELDEDSIVHRRKFLRTTRIEALLGASILVAAGLMTALTPAASLAGTQRPATYTAEMVVDGVDIQLSITPYPSGAGNYTFTVFLSDTNQNSYNNVTGVTLVMTTTGNPNPVTVVLGAFPGHTFHYFASAQAFPVLGTWNIAMALKRNNGPDISTTFVLAVT